MAISTSAFTGFRPEAIQFLADLAANNDRAWFQPRKADYERLLKQPLEALCVALSERFTERRLPFGADPARSPFRIYRDVRFSKDKSPYKTNIGADFPWAGETAARRDGDGNSRGAGVGGYFHVQPGEVFVGGGMWHPEPARLTAWRSALASNPGRVHEALDDPAFAGTYGKVNGDSLKRVPTGFPPDHPDAELLKLKDVVFGHRLSDADVFSARLPDLLADTLEAAVPVLRLLATLPA